uniref:Uncharacterized protein n=1 Tax=Timema tahoe TaxID=61484 RepID=A0A7R9P0H6_9NEOP|nr:unnamed protein product [Timema tahoe]
MDWIVVGQNDVLPTKLGQFALGEVGFVRVCEDKLYLSDFNPLALLQADYIYYISSPGSQLSSVNSWKVEKIDQNNYWPNDLTCTSRETRKVEAMGMKFLRSMLAVMRKSRIRNEVVRKRMGVHEIVKKARLRWHGHVMRMEKERMPKRMMEMKYVGKDCKGGKKEMGGADNRRIEEEEAIY